jgi:hypothetical protein
VCLKRLATFHISGLRYESVTYFLVCCVVVGSGRQFLLKVVNDVQGKSIVLGYCKYDLPFLLFSLFGVNIVFM